MDAKPDNNPKRRELLRQVADVLSAVRNELADEVVESKRPTNPPSGNRYVVGKAISDPAELALLDQKFRQRRDDARRARLDQINEIPEREVMGWIEDLVGRISPAQLQELHHAIGKELEGGK